MNQRPVGLPADARHRLTADLRARSLAFPEIADSTRSVPLIRESWAARLAALPAMLKRVETAASPDSYETWTYLGLKTSLARLEAARRDIVAMLIALAPFDLRDLPGPGDRESVDRNQSAVDQPAGSLTLAPDSSEGDSATATKADILRSGLLAAVDRVIDAALDAIEAGNKPPCVTVDLAALVPPVPTIAVPDRGTALAVAFGMRTVPVDGDGTFSASRVLEAHKYANSFLLAYLLTHMQAFGLAPTDDMLAMILVTGWIVQAPDAVLAWQTLRSTVLRLENAERVAGAVTEHDSTSSEESDAETHAVASEGSDAASGDPRRDVLSAVLAHLADREEALRQSRRIIQSSTRVLRSTTDTELAAHALADVYRRLVEGPVRQYGWAMRCLAAGSWSPPPMVGSLKDGFATDRWLSAALIPKLLPEVRNGQAHEALEWDGLRGIFVVEGVEVTFERVNIATTDCMSFMLGCEAAFVHWRALAAVPGAMFPAAGQPGRMAEWRRVEAMFGTNGLLIDTFTFNALRLEARIERLDIEDINPALQALVHARQLLVHVKSFAYLISGSSEAVIEVDASALDATHPVWLHAREHFDSMPLSTFLPANLNARLRHEPEDTAIQAVAWIAADCALGAIDGLPPIWQAEHLLLVRLRLEHTCLALRHTISIHQRRRPLEIVLSILDHVRDDLAMLLPFTRAALVDELPALISLRGLWTAWGPVSRMPGIDSVREDPSSAYHRNPKRRTISPHNRWINM